MDRLTQHGFDYCSEYCSSNKDCGYFKSEVAVPCGDKAIYDRLTEYEDTGLTPEALKDSRTTLFGKPYHYWKGIFNADCDNRLFVLPCKPGSEVWVIDGRSTYKGRVNAFRYSAKGVIVDVEYRKFGWYAGSFLWGETVFLTHEDALRRAENGRK